MSKGAWLRVKAVEKLKDEGGGERRRSSFLGLGAANPSPALLEIKKEEEGGE